MAEAMDSRSRKKQILEKRLEQLWVDYQAAISQSTNALSAVDSNKLDREANEIYRRIEKLDAEINSLDLAPSPNETTPAPAEAGRRHDLIRDKLPEIDFKALERALHKILDDFSEQGCPALLLFRHSRVMAGDWGAKRVRRILKDSAGEGLFRPIELEFNAWETVDAMALLQRLGEYLGVNPAASDFVSFSQSIAHALCGSLRSGSVVLIECRRCDDLLTQADAFRQLVETFWAELDRSLTRVAREYAEVRIVLLLLADEELADCRLPEDCCCTLDGYQRNRLLEIILESWTPADIGTWIGRYSGLDLTKRQIDLWAGKLHRANNGNPYMIAEALLTQCCPLGNG